MCSQGPSLRRMSTLALGHVPNTDHDDCSHISPMLLNTSPVLFRQEHFRQDYQGRHSQPRQGTSPPDPPNFHHLVKRHVCAHDSRQILEHGLPAVTRAGILDCCHFPTSAQLVGALRGKCCPVHVRCHQEYPELEPSTADRAWSQQPHQSSETSRSGLDPRAAVSSLVPRRAVHLVSVGAPQTRRP